MNIENIEVPEELESRLREALNRKRKRNWRALTTAAVILIISFGYMQGSGTGNFNEDKTEINWVYDFEMPRIYEKWLTLEIEKSTRGGMEKGSIKFTLDRSKALGEHKCFIYGKHVNNIE